MNVTMKWLFFSYFLTKPYFTRWVPFDIAKPLLDRKPYVILSDFPNLQVEDSSTPLIEIQMDLQHDNPCHEESNDVPFDEDEEMSEIDFEDSDDESGPETSVLASAEIEDASVGNIMIGLKGSRLRYKVNDSMLWYIDHLEHFCLFTSWCRFI